MRNNNSIFSNEINAIYEWLNTNGYILSEDSVIPKIVFLLDKERRLSNHQIASLMLTGDPGAGKTLLGEKLAEFFGMNLIMIQMHDEITWDSLCESPNIREICSRTGKEDAVLDGILLRALKSSLKEPTLVLFDELDKAPESIETKLLTVINDCMVSIGTEEIFGDPSNLLMVFTSNEVREHNSAFLNRMRKLRLPRLDWIPFAKALGLDPIRNLELGEVYNKNPEFSLRQGKKLVEDHRLLDLVEEGEEGNILYLNYELLSQYVEVNSLTVEEVDTSSSGKTVWSGEQPLIRDCFLLKLHKENSKDLIKEIFYNEEISFKRLKIEDNNNHHEIIISSDDRKNVNILKKVVNKFNLSQERDRYSSLSKGEYYLSDSYDLAVLKTECDDILSCNKSYLVRIGQQVLLGTPCEDPNYLVISINNYE